MGSSVLTENASVTLDASGNATLKMIPYAGSLTWILATVSVKASSNTNEATCRIYIGPAATDEWFVDGTFSGSTGDSTGRVAGRQVDTHGHALWAVWEGGDAGADATMTVAGTETRP